MKLREGKEEQEIYTRSLVALVRHSIVTIKVYVTEAVFLQNNRVNSHRFESTLNESSDS